MTFTDTELAYLAEQPLGRLATIAPDGSPQNNPVAYWLDTATGTIDIGGPNLARSRKFRNVEADPRVSLVVDDTAPHAVGPGGQQGRGIEVRGEVEIRRDDGPLMDGFSGDRLRLHPRRIVAWNVDGPGGHARDVG